MAEAMLLRPDGGSKMSNCLQDQDLCPAQHIRGSASIVCMSARLAHIPQHSARTCDACVQVQLKCELAERFVREKWVQLHV